MYRIIFSEKELPYQEFGFDAKEIAKGNLPSEQEFTNKIMEAFKKIKKEQKDTFSLPEFRKHVMEFYRDMRHSLMSGKPKGGTLEKIEKAKEQQAVLQKALAAKEDLLKNLSSNLPAAVKVLQEALTKKRVPVTFKHAGSGDPIPDIKPKSEYLIRISPLTQIKNHILTLQKNEKSDPAFPKAISTVRHELSQQIAETKEALAKVDSEIKMLSKRLESIGRKPEHIKIQQPLFVDPLGDIADIPMMLETMQFPREEKDIKKPHHYDWLYQHKFLEMLFKRLEDKGKDEKSESRYKSDIGEDAMPAIQHTMLSFLRLTEKMSKYLLGSASIFDQLDLKEHALTMIPESLYVKYTDYLKSLKGSLSAEEYKQLTDYYFDTMRFKVDEKELPDKLKADRAKLEKFYRGLHEILEKNQKRFEEKWKPVTNKVLALKKMYQDFKKLYNVASKEEYFQTWLKGGTPGWMTKKAGYEIVGAADVKKYKETEEMYQKVVTTLGDLRDYVKDSPLLKEDNIKDFTEVFKKTKDIDKWIDDLGTKITRVDTAINGYYTWTEDFIRNIISGAVLKTSSDYSAAISYKLRRIAVELTTKEEEHPEAWHSEYPLTIPLQKKKPSKEPPLMSKTYLDYFVKSFPIEEVMNEWFINLGGKKTLDPKKLPDLKKKVEDHIKKDMNGKVKKDILQKEHDEKEDALGKVTAEIIEANKKIRAMASWANKSFDQYDTAIEQAKGVSEAVKKDIKDKAAELKKINEEREALQKEFDHTAAKHITPEYVKKVTGKFSKLHSDYDHILSSIRDLLKESKTGENPFSGSKETIQSMETKAARVWNTYNDVIVRNTNRIEDLQDQEYRIENRMAEIQEWLQHPSVPEEFIEDGVRHFMAYVWHQIDEHWSRSIAAFQSRYNLNFEDYLDIRDEFEKLIKHPVSSRAEGRIVKEIKNNIRFLRDKGKEIPDSLYKALSKLTKKPIKDLEEYDEKKPEEKKAPEKEPEKSEEKKAFLFPETKMTMAVANKCIGIAEMVL
jgi:hypothetical protein